MRCKHHTCLARDGGGAKAVFYVPVIVAAIFDFMTEEHWGEQPSE